MSNIPQAETLLETAEAMVDIGWEPLPLKPRKKQPAIDWKEPITWTPDGLKAQFSGDANIGVALGSRSQGLVDIDFDWPEAAQIATELLSGLPSFGRKSSPASHRVAISGIGTGRVLHSLPPGAARKLNLERASVLEVRSDGHQTMFPPSVHPSGELVRWSQDVAEIPEVDGQWLTHTCGIIAALALVLHYYPRVPGDRDNICMALAGTLVRAGLNDDDAEAYISLIARLASDDEWEARKGKVAASRLRHEVGESTWGLPELCERLGITELEDTLRKWLGVAGGEVTSVRTSREITVTKGELHTVVDEAEKALIEGEVPIYQRGEDLVRPVRLTAVENTEGVRRDTGQLVLRPVKPNWLLEQMGRAATWWRSDGSKPVRIDPPPGVASRYLARLGEWKVCPLTAVIQCPTLRSDGSILQSAGYDRDTALLYDPGEVEFPPIPESPTMDEAIAALDLLERPFRAMDFADDASKSVAIAAILTALIRRTIETAPLFVFDAPTPGTGKSLIAETIGIIATGASPAMMSQGKTEEESDKRLGAALLAGDAIIVIDNCELPISGDVLSTMLTSTTVKVRILGKSEAPSLPSNALIVATGNNVVVEADLTRRTVICRLDAMVERPETRNFDFDPRDEARSQRPALVVAGLTILRAYIAAGRPVTVPALGSFADWSVVREALVWLGRADPVASRERLVTADPRREELAQLLGAWFEAFGSRATQLNALKEPTDQSGNRVHELLMDVIGGRDFNTRSIGKRLARYVDRPVNGLVLRRGGSSTKGYSYCVQKITSEEEPVQLAFAEPGPDEDDFPF
jgi:hypothetical protein